MNKESIMYIHENKELFILLFIIIGFGIFLILREITLWYFNINRIVSLLDSIDSKLDKVILNNNAAKSFDQDNEMVHEEHQSSTTAEQLKSNLDYVNDFEEKSKVNHQYDTKPFLERVKRVFTKKYYISDFFSSLKRGKDKEQ